MIDLKSKIKTECDRCGEDQWCSECPPGKFPKPDGNTQIYTGNTVDHELAAEIAMRACFTIN